MAEAAELVVLNAESEDCVVYALLSDGRILQSRVLDTKHCAEVHAKQVVTIPLTPVFLEQVLGYVVTDV